MALQLRKSIVRNTAFNSVLCLGVSLGLAWLNGMSGMDASSALWLAALVGGTAAGSAWYATQRIKQGILKPLSRRVAYVRVQRDHAPLEVDWSGIDDYASQLETRGFHSLGDFTTLAKSNAMVGVAAIFSDAAGTILIEVQQLQMKAAAGKTPVRDGVYFSINSLVGGVIRVVTCNHPVQAANYMIRGDHDVKASYPGLGLLALLDKHQRMLERLREKTGKAPSEGLSAYRHILMIREAQTQASRRIGAMSGLALANAIDAFEADPQTRWAPTSADMKALPSRELEALDAEYGAESQPALVDAPADLSGGTPSDAPVASTSDEADDGMEDLAEYLYQRALKGANWFYWIAGLSLLNIVLAFLGSSWGFALGLGASELLSGLARRSAGPETGLLFGGSIAVCALFAVFGWLGRRLSLTAFTAGIVLLALDTLVFLVMVDFVGILFHVVALYYLWRGLRAARLIRVSTELYRQSRAAG